MVAHAILQNGDQEPYLNISEKDDLLSINNKQPKFHFLWLWERGWGGR